jgi:hypothetical protein
MPTINFLPWRELQRARLKRWRWIWWPRIFCAGSCIAAIIFYLSIPPALRELPDAAATELVRLQMQLQQCKFTGYLQQSHRIWGIVILPDGKTIAVQAGSHLLVSARVITVTQTQLIISVPGAQAHVIIPLSHS